MFALCPVPVLTALSVIMTQNLTINQYLLHKNRQNILYFEEISICQDRKKQVIDYEQIWSPVLIRLKSNVAENKLIIRNRPGSCFHQWVKSCLCIPKTTVSNYIIFGKITSPFNWAWKEKGWVVGKHCTSSLWCNSVDMRSIFCPPLTKDAKQN